MKQFDKNYSDLYNLIYKNKNYKKDFLNIKKNLPYKNLKIENILDVGCGTGLFTKFFSKDFNSDVLGIDSSKHMLRIAKKNIKNKKIKFKLQKLEKFSSKNNFEIIYSLFHVLSYQIGKKNIENFFKIAKNNLKKDGLFIFDFWNKKAVLHFKPQNKLKLFKHNNLNIYNFVTPSLYLKKSIVNVNLEIYLEKNGKFENFCEKHVMRYFDLEEIKSYLKKNKLRLIKVFNHIKNKKDIKSWALTCITQKI